MRNAVYIPSLILVLLAGMLAGQRAQAQRVIVSEDMRQEDKSAPVFGMNRKHFRHSYAGIHFLAGQPDAQGADIRYGKSWSFEYGMRYKRRFGEVYSAGTDIFARRMAIRPEQKEGKLIPGPTIYDDEKLVYFQLGAGLYQRFNFGQRGNYIGRFLDTGGYLAWNAHVRHVYFFEQGDEQFRVKRTGMNFPALFEYGILARVGLNNLVIRASYRLSDAFSSSEDMPEIPRFLVGLEFGMHPR